MTEQAPVREDIPFPNGVAVPPPMAFQTAAAPVAQAPAALMPPPIEAIDPRLLAGAVPVSDHGEPSPGANGPSSPAAAAFQSLLQENAATYEWTAEKLFELIRNARDLPYDRLMTGAEMVVELATMLVADAARAGKPIDFGTALRSIHRISGMLSQRPNEFAALTTMFG